MTFKINFTQNRQTVQTWEGYASLADARAALRDADLIIPFMGGAEIVEQKGPNQ